MSSRLSEAEVMVLRLKESTWNEINKHNIKRVYIRAYPNSPMYGPYRVVDANKNMISKMDGTQVRYYPREKGLYIDPIVATYVTVKQAPTILPEDLVKLRRIINEVDAEIMTKKDEIDKLQEKADTLNKLRELYETSM